MTETRVTGHSGGKCFKLLERIERGERGRLPAPGNTAPSLQYFGHPFFLLGKVYPWTF